MKLERYILVQIVWPVVAALLVLNGLFLLVQLLKVGEVTFAAGLSVGDLLAVTVYFLPGFAVLTVPVAVLTGVLLGFGRMADDGELVALAAAGVAPSRLALVPVGLGLLAGLLAFGLGAWAAPLSARALQRTFVSLVKRQVVASLQPGRFFEEVPRVVFYPRRAGSGPGRFDGFLLYDHRPGRVRHALLARRAAVLPEAGGSRLRIELEQGEVHARGQRGVYSVASFEQASIALDIERLIRDRTRFLAPTARLGLAELGHPPPELDRRSRLRRLSAFHRRFAFPAACLVFGLLGTALAASGRLRGRRRTLVAAVGVVVGYYLLMRLGDVLADSGVLGPAWAAWLPDALFLLGACLWLIRRGRVAG